MRNYSAILEPRGVCYSSNSCMCVRGAGRGKREKAALLATSLIFDRAVVGRLAEAASPLADAWSKAVHPPIRARQRPCSRAMCGPPPLAPAPPRPPPAPVAPRPCTGTSASCKCSEFVAVEIGLLGQLPGELRRCQRAMKAPAKHWSEIWGFAWEALVEINCHLGFHRGMSESPHCRRDRRESERAVR